MITHNYKLIFFHIPKCAGRSVSEIFNQRFDQYTAKYYYNEYSRFWGEYAKFAIIRNPYARLVSMYHYIQQHWRHKNEPIGNIGGTSAPTFKEWVIANFEAFGNPFEIDSPEANRGTDWMLGSPHWFSPQWRFLDNPDSIDSIDLFKLEDTMKPVSEYLREHGVPNFEIPVLNTSSHKPYNEYYDQELLDYVKDVPFIHEDCVMFNYKFFHDDY